LRIVRTVAELRDWRASKNKVGFVPTMGAFHEGHLSLMRAAKNECGTCVTSLFVNPTQFAPTEDLSRYPRDEAKDAELAEAAGVDILFCPGADEVYPESYTEVIVSGVTDYWEGAARPGHFAGVALVVLKLFNMVQPTNAYFGLKDLQQCAVIRRMVKDLNVPLEVKYLETQRTSGGLALSSRNRYLSEEEFERAHEFPDGLKEAIEDIRLGHDQALALSKAKKRFEMAGMTLDYLALVDPLTMQECDASHPEARIMAAVRYAGIRLLDNMPLA
jgi:pantoate--beta-alanine ligase